MKQVHSIEINALETIIYFEEIFILIDLSLSVQR